MWQNKLLIISVIILLCGLAGCQVPGIGEAAQIPSVSPSPVALGATDVVTSTLALSTPTLTPSPSFSPSESTVTPTLTLEPTPMPFLCPHLRGHTEMGAFSSTAMYEDVRYLVHLPPCYESYTDRAFPVLYLLHGWPLDEYHWDSMGVDELADDWISRGVSGPFIIVMPGVGKDGLYVNSSGGSNSFEGMLVDELLPLIDSTYATWQAPAGRAIGGISRGGVWALEIALRHQDIFGIVGAHSPALALNYPLPPYDPFLLATEIPLSLRVYLDAGDKDWARSQTEQFGELLTEQDVDVTYQVHEGGHVDALWANSMVDYLDYYTFAWPRSYEALPNRDGVFE